MTSSRKILIVDDDPDLRKVLMIRLKAAGYTIQQASSGEQALAFLVTFRPHLVITDLRMEGMDGMTLFRLLQQHDPGLPTIILTAHGTIADAVEATHQGVFRFLTKPFDNQTLLEHVKKALSLQGNNQYKETLNETENWRADIITQSPAIERLLGQARLVADSEANIFISGESGTGKELLARAIHKASLRRNQPFIGVNCSAIPEPLFESELFGHTKGSFTGATKDHQGLFQAAHLGTLFLDEIGDLPLTLQTKLLRVLQEQQVRPVGATQSIAVDVRVISATHRNLEKQMETGQFREDLYYRLNVVSLEIPPLSERREDISLLARHFLTRLVEKNRKKIRGLSPEALEVLIHAPWPGNVRQLYNVIEQAVVLCITPLIPASLVQKAIREKPSVVLSLNQARNHFERDYLIKLLQMTAGNVSQAARLAQRNRTDFYKLLRRHALNPALFKCNENDAE